MSLGDLSHLPPEVLRLVCHRLHLEDVVSLTETHPALKLIGQNTFFRDLRRLEVDWNAKGATLSFDGPSLPRPMSIHTSSNFWEDVVDMATHIKEIVITKTEDAKNYEVVKHIARQGYAVRRLEIRLRPGKRTVSPETRCTSYKHLTDFVRSHRKTLTWLRLETDSENSVEFSCAGSSAVFAFSHAYDSSRCNQLITPMFNVMLKERSSVTFVTLRVDWGDRAGLILQSAFHAALPFEHRSRVLVLRLELGTGVSKQESPEIQGVLSEYAQYLNSINRLQHFICDLRHSTLEATELEKLYTTMSQEFSNDSHRISLLTAQNNKNNNYRIACR